MPQDSGKIYPVKKPARDPASLSLAQGSPEAITARLEEMERKLDRLRAIYETFFSGVERQPPNAPRRELNRLMLEMQQVQIRNAALRFRFQSLSQKWTLMTTYWNRTLREIEAGTYRKDVAKVSRRLAQKGAPLTEQEAVALGIPASRARALVARQEARSGRPAAAGASATFGAQEPPPAPPAAAPAAPSPRSRPSGVPGFSEDDLAALHRRYDEVGAHHRPRRADAGAAARPPGQARAANDCAPRHGKGGVRRGGQGRPRRPAAQDRAERSNRAAAYARRQSGSV